MCGMHNAERCVMDRVKRKVEVGDVGVDAKESPCVRVARLPASTARPSLPKPVEVSR